MSKQSLRKLIDGQWKVVQGLYDREHATGQRIAALEDLGRSLKCAAEESHGRLVLHEQETREWLSRLEAHCFGDAPDCDGREDAPGPIEVPRQTTTEGDQAATRRYIEDAAGRYNALRTPEPAPGVPTREQMALVGSIFIDPLLPFADDKSDARAVQDWLRAGAPQASDPRSWAAGIAECRQRDVRPGVFQHRQDEQWTATLWTANGVVAGRSEAGDTAEAALWAALDAQERGGYDGSE